ncbi:MAG: hypothetical protein JSS99_10575 [Actinobacteria bacterium]|nr:hypothetical protein [Actinomycetota bacterium]
MVTAQQVIAHIGHLPIGDPDAIRAHAARIEADADEIADRATHVEREVAGTAFEGPAAERWRSEMESCNQDACHAVDELHALAGRMRQVAARVAAQQAQWHRDFARVKARLEQAAHDALH